MTLAQELARMVPPMRRGEFVDLSWQRFRLPFDGRLSEEEKRLMEQGYGSRGTNFDALEIA